MIRVRQKFPKPVLEDISGAIRKQLQREGVKEQEIIKLFEEVIFDQQDHKGD